jgi:hypothetical protein
MATTTPNYGWDVPTSTDYVKDGATAIETLGDDIDASMFTALAGKKALQHLATGTINGTSVTVDNVFSSTYRNYLVCMSVTGGNSGSITLQYINSAGSVLGGSDYYTELLVGFANTAAASITNASSGHIIGQRGTGSSFATTFSVHAPNVAQDTLLTTNGFGYDGTNYAVRCVGGQYAPATVMRGFVISFPSGTTTGKITVYGYTE